MERIDPQKAARVWQRVQGESGISEGLLKELILEESMTATGWRQLGRNRPKLEQMERECRERIACLRGICQLLTGKMPEVPRPAPAQMQPAAILRAGYGRLMKCLARYEALQEDPTYGPAFVPMAAQTREHCRAVLALLGSGL